MNDYLRYWVETGGVWPTEDGQPRWRHEGPEVWFDGRESALSVYGYAIPTDEAIALLAAYSPIVEIGAGLGYWAKLLQDAGATVHPYDIAPPARAWTEVLPGGPEKAAQHPEATLFLCWPLPNDPMASDALAAYTGQHVIYIGDGPRGVTADADFYRALLDGWDLIDGLSIPRWWGYDDSPFAFRRRGRKP